MIDRYREELNREDASGPEIEMVAATTATKSDQGQVDWSIAAVRLLQGVVYQDENLATWEIILAHLSDLEDYFAKIGLLLVLDQNDAMAYLK